jgi:hypothetical protein
MPPPSKTSDTLLSSPNLPNWFDKGGSANRHFNRSCRHNAHKITQAQQAHTGSQFYSGFDIERFATGLPVRGKGFQPVNDPPNYLMRLVRQIETALAERAKSGAGVAELQG